MWRRNLVLGWGLVCASLLFAAEGKNEFNRIGVGTQYWIAVEDIDTDEVLQDGFSWYASYQMAPSDYFKLEFDFEVLPEEYGGAPEQVYAPQAYLVLGNGLYVAAGVGLYYTDGDIAEDPFYALRAGLDVEILPHLRGDLNLNYRFENWDSLSDDELDVDTDTLMVGAAVRLCF